MLYKQGMHVWFYDYQLFSKYKNKMSKRCIGLYVNNACNGSHNFEFRSM